MTGLFLYFILQFNLLLQTFFSILLQNICICDVCIYDIVLIYKQILVWQIDLYCSCYFIVQKIFFSQTPFFVFDAFPFHLCQQEYQPVCVIKPAPYDRRSGLPADKKMGHKKKSKDAVHYVFFHPYLCIFRAFMFNSK